MQPESQTQNNFQPVDEFIDQMLTDKGITHLDPEVRAAVIAELRDTLVRQIDREALLRLSEEKSAELDKILEENPDFTPEQIAQFVQDSGVDLTEVAVDTMLKFRNSYLGA